MIYIAADSHGTEDIFKLVEFFDLESQRKSLSKEDYVIICGDVGAVFDLREQDRRTCEILSSLPVTVLYVDGNHENFNYLEDYDIERWHGGNVHFIRDDIIHLMRGQVFEIEGKTFFTFGGAHSQDLYDRRENVSWWPQEIPNKYEMKEGLMNLDKYDGQIDYIITHTAPYEVLAELGMDIADEEEEFVRYLEDIRNGISFKRWFFGHLHMDEDLDEAAQRVLYELTGLRNVNLMQFKAFGSKNRTSNPKDVRWLERAMQSKVERIVTIAYLSMVKIDRALDKNLDDHQACWIALKDVMTLAFDHNLIIKEAMTYIRQFVEFNPSMLFELLPRKFTAAQLRTLFELVYDKPVDVRNFHKKIAMMEYVVPLEEKQQGVAHRAARYYKFDKKIYNKVRR